MPAAALVAVPHPARHPFWSINVLTIAKKLTSFGPARRAAAAVEFAICGLAIIAFLMVLLNLGLLGLDVSIQARATQATARAAAVAAARYYVNNNSYACSVSTTTSYSSVAALFDSFASPVLPASGTSNGSNPQITATWYNTPTSASTPSLPPGIALALTTKYVWQPLGFAGLGGGITLKLSTVAMVMGSYGTTATVNSDCGTTS